MGGVGLGVTAGAVLGAGVDELLDGVLGVLGAGAELGAGGVPDPVGPVGATQLLGSITEPETEFVVPSLHLPFTVRESVPLLPAGRVWFSVAVS
ncbi:MAG TPA: hypothetical protein VNF07_00245 [Acidimicrobiales bacterium]|nr:hypothetical protein [Acidimicrobiales bacterium]